MVVHDEYAAELHDRAYTKTTLSCSCDRSCARTFYFSFCGFVMIEDIVWKSALAHAELTENTCYVMWQTKNVYTPHVSEVRAE